MRPPRPAVWVAGTLGLALALVATIALVHLFHTSILSRVDVALDRFRDARSELTRAFVFLQRAGGPDSPYDTTQAPVLLDQAAVSMGDFARLWAPLGPSMATQTQAFDHQVAALKALGGRGSEVELWTAYNEAERTAEAIEDQVRAAVDDLGKRLDREFAGLIALATVLLVTLGALILGVFRERNRIEDQLDQVARDLKLGFWRRSYPGGVAEVSDTWRALVGLPPGSPATDEAWAEVIHPDDRDEFPRRFREFLDSTRTEFSGTYRVIHPDGSVHWLQSLVSARRDPRGKTTQAFGCNLDISESKALEEEGVRLRTQVAQAQKNDALGRLAGGIAHDLNNLLVPLMAYSDLGVKGALRHPPEHYFGRIKAIGERAAGLTRQILAFSRQQVLERRAVDLNALVGGFDPLLRRLVREDIRFQVVLEPDLPPIQADPGQVEQVLLNLVVNARDAMPKGGILGITTEFQTLDEAFLSTHFGTQPGDYVVLTVRDTGVGMSPEVMNRVFEPFFTTKPRGEGTGLGLATVQGIVKQHGGQVGVYSEPGHGTVFRVYWPACDDPKDQGVPEAAVADVGGSETLVVVEDERLVREVIAEALAVRGYTVVPFGESAQARDYGGPCDLLITDVVMPDLNGRELWQALRTTHPGLRVLYVSGYTDHILPEAPPRGQGFLQKPFSVDALARKVRELLEGPEPDPPGAPPGGGT